MIRPPASSAAATGFLQPPELPGAAQPPAELRAAAGLDRERWPAAFAGLMKEDAAQSETRPADDPLRVAFRDFVGQTLFGQMLASMRSTVGKPAYFHGGRAEEVFSQQLDQALVEQITEASASTVADPMFELFNMQRM